MTGPKTNERPGTRAVLRGCGIPASKVRAVLDLIRGQEIDRADEVLRFSERAAARPVRSERFTKNERGSSIRDSEASFRRT